MKNQEKQTLERENRVFGGIEVFRIGFKTLFYKARSEMAVLPPISNFWPVGTILCRSAQYCADGLFWQPVAAGGHPTQPVVFPRMCLGYVRGFGSSYLKKVQEGASPMLNRPPF